jgi:hypothetical protein
MKAGSNKENQLAEIKKDPSVIEFTSPERKIVQKVLRFEQEKTPDRPIHRRIPSLVSKDYRNGFRHKIKGKKSMELEQKSYGFKSSPNSFTKEMKSSIASTDVRGLSLFSSEVEGKKEVNDDKSEVNDSITEKLACESYCYNCKRYVYTKVTFKKSTE